MATTAAQKKKKNSITHVAFQHVSLEHGADLVANLVRQRNEIAEIAANTTVKWQGIKKATVDFMGERVKMNARLIEMASYKRLDVCAGCGRRIDGFFVGYDKGCGTSKTLDGDGLLQLIPVIHGQLVTCDHIIPQTLGGRDTGLNMQSMCNSCNSKKGHLILDSDLALVENDIIECVSGPGLYSAARAITKEYRTSKNVLENSKGVKPQLKAQFQSRMNKAENNLVNLRKLISFVTPRGISMIPHREQEIGRAIENKQKIPA